MSVGPNSPDPCICMNFQMSFPKYFVQSQQDGLKLLNDIFAADGVLISIKRIEDISIRFEHLGPFGII